MLDFDWSIIEQSLPLLQKGILVTLKITITSSILGMVLGTLLALPAVRAQDATAPTTAAPPSQPY